MNPRTLIALLVSGALFGCNSSSDDIIEQEHVTQVNIVTANMWQSLMRNLEGTSDYHIALEEFRHADADILLLSEASGITARIAEQLGMYFWQGHDSYVTAGIVSKFPIIKVYNDTPSENDAMGGGVGVVVDINGREVTLWSNHLDYRNYVVYDARGGDGQAWAAREGCVPVSEADEIDALNLMSSRPSQTQYMLDELAPANEQGKAIFIGGDFNESSGLDWTEETAYMFDHNGTVHDFMVHRMIRAEGYVDSYRELYPNPVTHPGLTWPFHIDDSWTQSKSFIDECGRGLDDRDRIDLIYHSQAEGLELLSTSIIGPRAETYFPGPDGNDDLYDWQDPHSGIMVDEDGEPYYGPREFVSDHLWYKATYNLVTPNTSTEAESLNLNPEFSNLQIAAEGEELVLTFTLDNWKMWEEDRDYHLVVAGDSTNARLNSDGTYGWQSESLSVQPNGEFEVRVAPEVYNKLKEEGEIDLHSGLQLRAISLVSGWYKQYAVLTIPTEDIEAVVNL
ncbi:endonuclease/exonuclease/phosphatase family protein [Photobacterium sp. DNB23_23_1]|uniref:Endonuclease/exonuclease/phosphatase family protein n=1 Tax=Photobacterium pectinilyticum TaxID=2906793 RepID=A0ABT1N622_9GAMM|nr:endonuclease/exonuclease/phosphatase family protein [Photobacterium sp. ZSDE20]MCQ1060203.1 endonuclease/exonuclease/phosphatase family protein [Photobacterium sp. ZSDE20]MDD1827636.1 endonuclease/exonuclease/phosphatase family protein [Photobacterium sp. ZSDE20]